MPYQLTTEENKVHFDPQELLPYYEFNRSFSQNQNLDEVTSIAIEAGLKKIITGSQSGALIVWDEETYEKKDEFKVHTDSINCIVTTSSHLFTASDDGTVGVWEKPSMNLLKKLEGHSGWVYSVAIHDKYIFTSSYDGSIKVWDKTSYSLIATWSHHVVSVNSLLVIKDILISGAADGKLFAWKIDDQLLNNPQNQLIGHHSDGISSLCGSEDKDYGLRFYSASHDGVIKVWDFATFQMVREISAGNCVINVSVSRRRIYALTDSGISTFHALTGQLIQSMKIEGTDPRCLSIASDESRAIFVGCSNNTIRNWKAITSSSDAKVDHKGSVLSVWVDEIQCYSSGEDKQILIWDKNTREILATLKGHQRKVNCLYVLDEYLYSASDDGTVIVWNKITHEKVATLEHSKSNVPVSSVVVDAGRIYTQSPFEVIVWNKQSFERISDNQPFFRSPEGRFKGFSVYNGNIYVGCGHDLRISLKIEHTSNQYAPRTFVCDNNIRYVVAKENAIYVGTDKEVLICNAKKNPLEVTSQFKTSGPVNAIVIKYNRIILACGKSPSMTQASPNAAFAPIEIRDSKTGQRVLQSLAGHKGFVYCLYFSEGIIYSGSSDRTVRLWDAQLYDMPAFFQQAMTQELSVQKAEYVDTLDSSKRSALMAAARTGSTANARKLLDLGTKYNFDYISEFGESAIFFALREGHWDFLQEFSTELTIRIRKEDLGSFALMGHRAMAGDYQFFEKLKICNISFPQRSVLDTAIRHNHVIFAKKWTDLSHSYMLHSACFYGRPQCVKALVKRDVDINQKDPKNENRTAVQICHLTARQYSEISEIARIKKEDGKSVKLDIEPIPKERRSKNPDTIYDEYETNLIRRRTECFNIIAGITEISKKPNFTEKDDKNFSSYDQALAMHNYTMIKMKQPRDEQKDREIIQRRNQMFADSSSVLDEYHKDRQVIAVREKYANIMFLKESTIYILYLLILTFVGILCTTNNTTHSYDMGTAVQSYLIGDDFSGVNSAESMFDWLQSSFLPCIYPENENGTHLILKSNLAIGGIQLKQMKIKDNSCKERNLYNADFTDCFAPTLTLKTMDRSSFGPDNRYVFNENKGGDWYWAEDGVWYPPGGFIEVLPTNNSAIATAMIEDLKNNEWVTDGTRAIFVSISLYNGNMNGLFGIVRLSFFFSAIGDVTTDSDVIILSPYSYDRDPASGTVWKILLQFLVVFYILYAFLYTEITEIRESVEESRVFLDLFDEKAVEKKESARWRGLKKYALNAWNIFEWTIISVFFMLFIMELVVVTFWGSLNLHPIPIDYINFQSVAIIMSYQHDLYAFFMLLCWLRLLKFLRIPPYTGPLVQSVLDTLKSTTVIVFVGIVLYIVVVFSLAFHVAFGPDVGAYNNFGNSIMTLVQVLFGNSDFDSLRESNKVFGPLLFLFFMFFIVFVLMNLLVGVLGEAYNNVSEVNSERWNRYITRMMISELDQKLVEPTITFGKLYEKVFGSRRFLDVEAKMNPMTAATDVQPNYQTIYKTDDEMDDIVAKKEYEELVDNGEDEDEEEEATIEEAKDELVAKIQNLEIANAKTNKKLNEILKLLKSDQ